tara:strand:+ start:485 stop:652 length:168 start_codon:yes stop_codon:yes gene_type:complete
VQFAVFEELKPSSSRFFLGEGVHLFHPGFVPSLLLTPVHALDAKRLAALILRIGE